MLKRYSCFVPLLLLAGCAAPLPPPPEIPQPPPPTPSLVWTAEAETVVMREDRRRIAVAHPFTRLDVRGRQGADSIRVRCDVCAGEVEGIVSRQDVVLRTGRPAVRDGESLPEFLAALRASVAERDLDALRPVMSRWFTFAIEETDGAEDAIRRWRSERFIRLDRLPELLDRGVATRDGELWIAPADFVEDPGYRGPRAGFEREDGRWRWLFFVGS